jgi:hypothetical protein
LEPFSKVRVTASDNIKPAHPFCNHSKEAIEEVRKGKPIRLPELMEAKRMSSSARQLFLFGSPE